MNLYSHVSIKAKISFCLFLYWSEEEKPTAKMSRYCNHSMHFYSVQQLHINHSLSYRLNYNVITGFTMHMVGLQGGKYIFVFCAYGSEKPISN